MLLPKYRWRLQRFPRFVTSRGLRESVSIHVYTWTLTLKLFIHVTCCWMGFVDGSALVCAGVTWSTLPLPNLFINDMFISVCFLGAHSHIRGLGLDDALEPRQVASYVWPCKVFTHLNQNYFIFDIKLSCILIYLMSLCQNEQALSDHI